MKLILKHADWALIGLLVLTYFYPSIAWFSGFVTIFFGIIILLAAIVILFAEPAKDAIAASLVGAKPSKLKKFYSLLKNIFLIACFVILNFQANAIIYFIDLMLLTKIQVEVENKIHELEKNS